jgi:DNA gyrase inhibitor GyrI
MKVTVPIVILVVIGLIVALMYRLGAFRAVELSPREAGPFRVAYKRHIGPYYKIVPAIQEVEAWAKRQGEACASSFGEYLDDPRTVDEDRLRSNGGCVLLQPREPLPDGILAKTIERRLWLTASFRGAPSIGPYKVYPRAAEWIAENGYVQNGPTIEMYRVISEKDVETTYYFPIARPEGAAPPPDGAAPPEDAPVGQPAARREGAPPASATTSPRKGG